MHYHWSRFFLAAILFLLATGLYYAWKIGSGNSEYSLINVLGGRPAPATAAEFTPQSEPLIDLNEIQLLSRLNQEYTTLMQRVVPSVVSINTKKTYTTKRYYWDWNRAGFATRNVQFNRPSLGSGFIVSEQGHVMTSYHVIADVDEIQVTRSDGKSYRAEVVGSDLAVDLTILKITGRENEVFPALPLGDSDKVQVGEMVFAIGNPFGLSESVTRGIISAKERRLTDADTEFFQTDAVINPGSSGGPLVNLRGEVVAINASIYSGAQEAPAWQGIGLAIPANDIRASFESIMLRGSPGRGYLGIVPEELYPHVAIGAGLPSDRRGVHVLEVVADSPAAAAELQPADIILSFGDTPLEGSSDLIRRVREIPVGTRVKLGLWREGQQLEVEATIGERTREVAIATQPGPDGERRPSMSDLLGVMVRKLEAREKLSLGLHPETAAIIITEVSPNSPAAKSLQPNDLIHEVNRQPVDSAEQFFEALNAIPLNRSSALLITRNGSRALVVLHTHTTDPHSEGR